MAVVGSGRAVNAMIRDSESIKKEMKVVSIWDKLLGRKIKLNDDETFTVLDEEKVISQSTETRETAEEKWDDPEKVIKKQNSYYIYYYRNR